MKTGRLRILSSLLLVASLLGSGATASAQSRGVVIVADAADTLESPYAEPSVEEVAPATSSPRWRLDVGAPGFGPGGFFAPAASYERSIVTMTFDVRFVESHGHGVMARYVWGTNLWGGGHGVDLDYVFRARLAGDDRFGLGLDTMAGMTLGALVHNDEEVPVGAVAGANVGLQLDLRLYGFVVSLGTQYRLLLPTETAANGGPIGPEHALTGTLGLGFGFWG